jgi:polyhydroxyalkanoic acid synthase PhaR subunit
MTHCGILLEGVTPPEGKDGRTGMSDPGREAFELWRKAVEDGMQAWARAVGPAPVPPPAAPAFPDITQLWRPILAQGMELWQKAAAQGGVTPEFTQAWKSVLDQSIEAWSKALTQAMGTEGFAQALGRYLDQTLVAQAPWKKAFEEQTDLALRSLGLPSRSQVVSVASQLVALEERIEGLEERLDALKALVSQTPRATAADEAVRPGRSAGQAGRRTPPRRAGSRHPRDAKEEA